MPNPEEYIIGWICALPTEHTAARLFLDEEHEQPDPDQIAAGDSNAYVLGVMAGHKVVIAVLPHGEYGTTTAATVATDMLRSFTNVRVGLMVGVGGGAPTSNNDIRLGDVVVSSPKGGKGGVYQYDYGKRIQGCDFKPTGHLNQPPPAVLTAMTLLVSRYERKGNQIGQTVDAILGENPRLKQKYGRPEVDILYTSSFVHPSDDGGQGCERSCATNAANVVNRLPRETEGDLAVHFGTIASGNSLIKDALFRDSLAREEVLCFEMEAAGLSNRLPLLVVRGICDYSDSHKNKKWQGYAAMTAAAYTKDLLKVMLPERVEGEKRLTTVLESQYHETVYTHAPALHMDSTYKYQQAQHLRTWLSPSDPSVSLMKGLERRHLDTCQWLLDGDEYRSWRTTPSSFFWLHGSPGCGKTFLASAVIQQLRSEGVGGLVVYYFFGINGGDKRDLSQMLRSLLYQLSSIHPKARQTLQALYKDCGMGAREPTVKQLSEQFAKILDRVAEITVVVDALDECDSPADIVSWLEALYQMNHNSLHLFVTSRKQGILSQAIDKWHKQDQLHAVRNINNHKDIANYIHARLFASEEFERWKSQEGLLEHVEEAVLQQANGIFLLAACQLDELKSCRSRLQLMEALSTLPTTLQVFSHMKDLALANTPIEWETESEESRSSSEYRAQSYQESNPTGFSVSDTAPSSFVLEAYTQIQRSLEIPTSKVAVHEDPSEDDAGSVTTVDDDIESYAESETPHGLQKIASERLINALSGDAEISALYDESCVGQHAMTSERFIRNHVKLLKTFFLDVSHETHDTLSKQAARFLRSHKRRHQISAMIYQNTASTTTLQLDDGDRKEDMHKVEEYLSKLLPHETEPISQKPDIGDSDSEFAYDSEDDEVEYPNFEAAVTFLTSSQAFKIYKTRLRRFAKQLPQPGIAFQKALDNEALDEATELLEHEYRAISSCKEHQYLRHYLDLGFHARDVVALLIESESWKAANDDWRNLWAHLGTRFRMWAEDLSRSEGNIPDPSKIAGYSKSTFAAIRSRLRSSCTGRMLAKMLRPAIPKGYSRIEWTCICGKSLFEDVRCNTPASLLAVQNMFARVSTTPVNTTSDGGVVTSHQGPEASAQVGHTPTGSSGRSKSPPKPARDQDNQPPADSNTNPGGDRNDGASNHKRLYICAKSGELTLSVREIDASSLRNDFEYFARIREEYRTIRRHVRGKSYINRRSFGRIGDWLWTIQLTRPGKAFFVQFRRSHDSPKYGTLVELLKKPSIPPNPPANHGYHYEPAPLESESPMTSNNFIHFLREPEEAHMRSVEYGLRFPKKTGNSMLSTAGPLPAGWGIEIEEELNTPLLFKLYAIYAMIVTILMLLWVILEKDKASFATYVGNFISLLATPWGVALAMDHFSSK